MAARPACSCQGAKNDERMIPAGHLLHADHQHRVVLAGADRAGGQGQRGAAGRAPGLDVDDRDAGQGQRAEHTVAGGHAAVGGGAEGGPDAGPGRRPASPSRRRPARSRVAATPMSVAVQLAESPERVQPDAGDLDAVHGAAPVGAKAQIRWPPASVSTTTSIGWPKDRAVGVGLGQATDHPQALVGRARPPRTRRAPVPRSPVARRSPRSRPTACPDRDSAHRLDVVGPAVGTDGGRREVVMAAGRGVAADQRTSRRPSSSDLAATSVGGRARRRGRVEASSDPAPGAGPGLRRAAGA